MKKNDWDRLLWGVEFVNINGPVISAIWEKSVGQNSYDGEPMQPLLFCSRASARRWCAKKMREWRTEKNILSLWKVRPVRVRETIRRVGK